MGRGHGLSAENPMLRHRTVASLVAAVAAAGLTVPAAASAGETIGKKVRGPAGACKDNWVTNDNVQVCFHPRGEYLFVKDKASDGRSAYGEITSRDDVCRNPYGAGTWVRCNYSFREGSPVTFRGYTQDNEGSINWKRNETTYTSRLA